MIFERRATDFQILRFGRATRQKVIRFRTSKIGVRFLPSRFDSNNIYWQLRVITITTRPSTEREKSEETRYCECQRKFESHYEITLPRSASVVSPSLRVAEAKNSVSQRFENPQSNLADCSSLLPSPEGTRGYVKSGRDPVLSRTGTVVRNRSFWRKGVRCFDSFGTSSNF